MLNINKHKGMLKSNIIKSWLFFFIILFLLYAFSIIWLSQYTRQSISRNLKSTTEYSLSYICDNIDSFADNSDKIYTTISSNEKTQQILNSSSSTPEGKYMIYAYQKELQNFFNLQENFKYLLWVEGSNIIITPNVVLDTKRFYEYNFASYFKSYDDFMNGFLNISASISSLHTIDGNIKNDMLLYSRSILYPTMSGKKIKFISYSAAIDLLHSEKTLFTDSDYLLVVKNRENPIFYQSSIDNIGDFVSNADFSKEHIKINNTDYIRFYYESNKSNISLCYFLSSNVYNKSIRRFNFVLILIFIILIMINITLSYWFIKKNYNPIKNLLQLFGIQKRDNINELDAIGEKYIKYKEVHLNTVEQLKIRNDVALHYIMLNLILDGSIREDDLGILFDNEEPMKYNFIVVLQSDISSSLLRSISDKFSIILNQGNIIKKSILLNDELVFLINTDKNDSRITDDLLLSLCEFCQMSYSHALHIGISKTCSNYFELSQKYTEAKNALKYARNSGQNIVHTESLSNQISSSYYYPPETEKQILECLKKNNFDKVSEIINKLYKINLEERQLEPVMIDYLFYNLTGTISKFMDQVSPTSSFHFVNSSNLPYMLSECKNTEEKQSLILKILSTFKDTLSIEDENKELTLIKSVKKYIKINYSNPDINVSAIAMRFEIRQDYLSRIFKQNEGVGLLEYLNTSRLDKAADLLKNTNTNITEISKMVGFYNYRTFSRQFIKHFTISPQNYRDGISEI